MKVTAYEATVVNGQVRLPESVRLPENATVYVVLPDPGEKTVIRAGSPRLAQPERAADFTMEVTEESPGAGLR
jgi:hypothetical protein